MDIEKLSRCAPIVKKIVAAKECVWINPNYSTCPEAPGKLSLSMADVMDAEARLLRFAPYIKTRFPETVSTGGLIESPLTAIFGMAALLKHKYSAPFMGSLYLKRDSDLAVAGSVKARGGIYEVLQHAEQLAISAGLLNESDDYSILCRPEFTEFFGHYAVQVGSTGNLGLSIGIMSAALGFRVTVHMSADARQWKKDLLRKKGVTVIEYASDYSEAVKQGRARSEADPMSYFVDDENSTTLFLGYAVAALRLQQQLFEQGITVDGEHPLFVYIPCGVGGAPGGIAFGLKLLFSQNVHVFFVEPTQCPCMLLGMATGLNNGISVQDVGLSGKTHADGLAVGRPSGFVGSMMKSLLSGEFTCEDYRLYNFMRELMDSENLFIEPSACAAFIAPLRLGAEESSAAYLAAQGLTGKLQKAAHIVWATGGSLVPPEIRSEYARTVL